MEPYREDQPWIRFNPDAMKQSLLETILSIPGARALKHYHDNPESSAGEFIDLLAEDIVPLYANVLKPAFKGEDIDWERAAKEFAMLGTPAGGPGRALGTAAIKLEGKSGAVNVLTKPETIAEVRKFRDALNIAVRKNQITRRDADKMFLNALEDIQNEARIAKSLDADYLVEQKPFLSRDKIQDRDKAEWDKAANAGLRDQKEIVVPSVINDPYNKGTVMVDGKEYPTGKIYLQGDQGPLWINEHVDDANRIRHNTNYDEVWKERLRANGGKFGKLHTEGHGLGDAFNNVYKPLLLDEAIRNKRLGYNYKAASGRSIEEGRRATKEDPKYKTVDELYKIILDLPTKK